MEEGLKLWGWLDAEHPDPIAATPAVEAWLARTLGLPALAKTPPVVFNAGKRRVMAVGAASGFKANLPP